MNLKTFKKELSDIDIELKSIHDDGKKLDETYNKFLKVNKKRLLKFELILVFIVISTITFFGMYIVSFLNHQEIAALGYLCLMFAMSLWALKISKEDLPKFREFSAAGFDEYIRQNNILKERCDNVRKKLDNLK